MNQQNSFESFKGSISEMKRNELNKYQNSGIYDLHFETDEKKAEELKKAYGKKVGETSGNKQIEAADYSLKKFRKLIGFGKGDYVGVFLPGSYDASTSELGDGPHKKEVKKVKWTQKKYDQWLSDVASNGGAENAADMAQNAKEESGLIDWVKKQFRGDDPMQRIQWDIEGFAESVVTEGGVVYNSSNTDPKAAKQATKEFGKLLPKANKGVEPYVFAVIKTKARNYRLAIKSGSYVAHEFMSGLQQDGILTADIVKKAVANVIKLNPEEFNESVVTEAKFVKDFNKEVLDVTTKEEVLKLYPGAEFFIGKSTHFFGELDTNLFFKAYYTKKQEDFKITTVYSKKGSNYVNLYTESVNTTESVVNEKVDYSEASNKIDKFLPDNDQDAFEEFYDANTPKEMEDFLDTYADDNIFRYLPKKGTIKGFAEYIIKNGINESKSLVTEAKDNLYLQLHKKYAESIKGLKAKKIKKLTDLVSVQRWSMEDREDYFDMDPKKKKELSAEYKNERKLFKQYLGRDYDVMLPKGTESLAESLVTEAKLKFTKADISYQLTIDYSGRTKPRVKKFTTKEIHVVYGYKVDPQSVIDSIKILDPDLKVTHIEWSNIASGGGVHSFKINESASNESINEGKWGNIMKGVRKGSKSGPWTVVSIQNNKVVNQEHVDIMDAIPAFYEKAKKEFPKARISIEDNEGHSVYNESKVTNKLKNTMLFEQYLNEGVLFGKKGIKIKLEDKIKIAKEAVSKYNSSFYIKVLDKLEKQLKSGKIDAKDILTVQGTSEEDMPGSFDIFDGGNSNQLAVQIAKVLKKYKKHETDNSQTKAAAGWSGTAMSSVSGKIQAGVSFGTGRETYLIGVMIGSGIPSNISDKIKQEIYNLLFIFDQFGGNDGGVYVSDSQGSNYDSIGLICRKYSFNDAVGRSLTDIMNNR